MTDWKDKDESYWRQKLTDDQFAVCRQKGTERPFTGKYNDEKRQGRYKCVACGAELFSSDEKYESGSGWPSFYAPAVADNVAEQSDTSHGMVRTEITCNQCGSHLGHVFEDGPPPTGLRYCLNSVALDFEPESE